MFEVVKVLWLLRLLDKLKILIVKLGHFLNKRLLALQLILTLYAHILLLLLFQTLRRRIEQVAIVRLLAEETEVTSHLHFQVALHWSVIHVLSLSWRRVRVNLINFILFVHDRVCLLNWLLVISVLLLREYVFLEGVGTLSAACESPAWEAKSVQFPQCRLEELVASNVLLLLLGHVNFL